MRAPVKLIIQLAALVWYAGAVVLSLKCADLLHRAWELRPAYGWPALSLSAGILIGLLRGRSLFAKVCRNNINRIAELERPRIWNVYRIRFYFLLVLMIGAGLTLSWLADWHYAGLVALAGLDGGLATALIVGGLPFWRPGPSSRQGDTR